VNHKKIAFITCVNNEQLYKKSLDYINNLNVPANYEIEAIKLNNITSITEGYNKAMQYTNAKYKVYMHQDVFIANKNFIIDITNIFQENNKIGLLGVIGTEKIPDSGIWWKSNSNYGKVYSSHTGQMQLLEFTNIHMDYQVVQAIDGLIMITQYDIPWRDDLFDGWHFYDIAQSIEFKKAGYKVCIPQQIEPWCIHDCGIIKDKNNYKKYRNIFLNEYVKEVE